MFRSQDIQVFVLTFNIPMIYQVCDVMMSIIAWSRVHFQIYFLNHNSLSH